jgi:hypothetical protein
MQRKNVFLSTCFILALTFFLSRDLHAEKAAISDLLMTNNANHLLVYARAVNCFTKDIETAILAGVPTTFTFLIHLYKERRRWLDQRLTSMSIRHTIKYDNVKKLFTVIIDGDQEPTTFQDFESAKRAMSDLNGISLAPLNMLKRNEFYYVEIKAKLDKVRLPLHMEYVFSFVSLWDFETDWYREGFFY